jgi:hypothetical protein
LIVRQPHRVLPGPRQRAALGEDLVDDRSVVGHRIVSEIVVFHIELDVAALHLSAPRAGLLSASSVGDDTRYADQ